jgi:hypothetical protein
VRSRERERDVCLFFSLATFSRLIADIRTEKIRILEPKPLFSRQQGPAIRHSIWGGGGRRGGGRERRWREYCTWAERKKGSGRLGKARKGWVGRREKMGR